MKKKLFVESDLRPKPQDDPKLYFGPMTQKQVAKALGMSERGVRQAETRGMRKLRRHLVRRKIWDLYLSGKLGVNSCAWSPAKKTKLI